MTVQKKTNKKNKQQKRKSMSLNVKCLSAFCLSECSALHSQINNTKGAWTAFDYWTGLSPQESVEWSRVDPSVRMQIKRELLQAGPSSAVCVWRAAARGRGWGWWGVWLPTHHCPHIILLLMVLASGRSICSSQDCDRMLDGGFIQQR